MNCLFIEERHISVDNVVIEFHHESIYTVVSLLSNSAKDLKDTPASFSL